LVCDPINVETYNVVVGKFMDYNRVTEMAILGQSSSPQISELGTWGPTQISDMGTSGRTQISQGSPPSSDMNNNRVTEIATFGQSAPNSSSPSSDINTLYGIVCNQFLQQTSSQVTAYGLSLLFDTLPPMKPAVFFRNNHFSTIIKSHDKLWTLVTDEGFLELTEIVWESVTMFGNSEFVDSYFGDEQLYAKPSDDADLALAIMLQDEEDEQLQQMQQYQNDSRTAAQADNSNSGVFTSEPLMSPPEEKKKCVVQ
jgi:hypothetical protein